MGKKTLPVYKIVINPDDKDETGINSIALVDKPAIQSNFIKFNEDIRFSSDDVINSINNINVKFKKTDELKHILTGALLIPDKEIYRKDIPDVGECLWVFDADTIEVIRDKYHRNKKTSNVNLEHQTPIDDCYIVESYIVNKDKGLFPTDLVDIIDGTWVVSMKIENDEVWNSIIEDEEYKGFSIDGVINMIETKNKSTITYSAADYYNNLLKEYYKTVNDLTKL